MSGKIVGLVFDEFPGSPIEKLTALALADHAGHDGSNVRPGIELLAKKTGLDGRTIKRHLKRMVEIGWLEVVKHASGGRGNVTEYRFPIERLKGVTVTPFKQDKECHPCTPFETERVSQVTQKGDTERKHSMGNVRNRQTVDTLSLPDTSVPVDTCAELSISSANTPLFITLTLNTGEEYPVHDLAIAEWSKLFPAVDVKQDLRAMRAWLMANPKQRKTKTGILRFVVHWLSRTQNRGGNRSPPPQQPQRRFVTNGRYTDPVQIGKQHGIEARPGESMEAYLARVNREIEDRKRRGLLQ